jgi:hypothetical protein
VQLRLLAIPFVNRRHCLIDQCAVVPRLFHADLKFLLYFLSYLRLRPFVMFIVIIHLHPGCNRNRSRKLVIKHAASDVVPKFQALYA